MEGFEWILTGSVGGYRVPIVSEVDIRQAGTR